MEPETYNKICITQVAATIDALLGVPCHEGAAAPIGTLIKVPCHDEASPADALPAHGCDRVFMYNPDAVASWIYDKYRNYFITLEEKADVCIPMLSVFPPVTPVCFASMYSGLMPKEHGIRKYEKPILTVKTVFDDIPATGKRAAIVSTANDSISMIFLNRNIDYFIYPTKEECNRKALELIHKDEHDLIVLYNGDYDHYMHRVSPDGKRALRSLQENIKTYTILYGEIKKCWASHRTALSFAPDHGCHEVYKFFGNHGMQAPCDMNINHFWSFI